MRRLTVTAVLQKVWECKWTDQVLLLQFLTFAAEAVIMQMLEDSVFTPLSSEISHLSSTE